MKYRILAVTNGFGTLYMPQYKAFFWWKDVNFHFDTLEKAKKEIEFHKKKRIKSIKEVVWNDDYLNI